MPGLPELPIEVPADVRQERGEHESPDIGVQVHGTKKHPQNTVPGHMRQAEEGQG